MPFTSPTRRPDPGRWRERALWPAMLAAVLLSLGACRDSGSTHRATRIACLGDSNTFALPPMTGPGWCELLDAQLSDDLWQVRGFAYLGATVSGESTSTYTTAADHIAKAEAEWRPDVYVLAYGTNDLKRSSPAAVVAAYLRQRDALIRLGRRVMVATTPPVFPPTPPSPAVAELNALLRRQIPPQDLVDFDSIVESSDYDADGRRVLNRDGIHVNVRGQEKRARAVRAALLGP